MSEASIFERVLAAAADRRFGRSDVGGVPAHLDETRGLEDRRGL